MADNVETMRVRDKNTGAEMVINKSDFREQDHEKIQDEQSKRQQQQRQQGGQPPRVQVSEHSREDLAGMSVEELNRLPELQAIAPEERNKLRTKDQIIDRVMTERSRLQAEQQRFGEQNPGHGPGHGRVGGTTAPQPPKKQ